MVLLAILLTFGCLVYLWQWMNFLQKSYEVQRLEKDHQQMIVRLEMLRVEAAFLSRPQRLEALALNQMQMRLPNSAQLNQSEFLYSDEISHP
jgi:cell division protein FtsL